MKLSDVDVKSLTIRQQFEFLFFIKMSKHEYPKRMRRSIGRAIRRARIDPIFQARSKRVAQLYAEQQVIFNEIERRVSKHEDQLAKNSR